MASSGLSHASSSRAGQRDHPGASSAPKAPSIANLLNPDTASRTPSCRAVPPLTDHVQAPARRTPADLLPEIFGRLAPAPRDPNRPPILARDYPDRPTPLAWRDGACIVDYEISDDGRTWACPRCDFRDWDAHVVADHRAAAHKGSKVGEDRTAMVRYFIAE